MTLTGFRDTDFLIMEKLDDKSLLNLCLTNKRASVLCREQNFWKRRFVSKFGETAAKYKPEQRSWKNHYLKVIIDLDRFSENPVDFLNYIVWGNEGAKNSHFVNYGESIINGGIDVSPFLDSPEWVMNNFYLLDLGPAYINGSIKEHVTPYMLFESEAKGLEANKVLHGLGYARDDFWRYEH